MELWNLLALLHVCPGLVLSQFDYNESDIFPDNSSSFYEYPDEFSNVAPPTFVSTNLQESLPPTSFGEEFAAAEVNENSLSTSTTAEGTSTTAERTSTTAEKLDQSPPALPNGGGRAGELCQVNEGKSNIILDVVESAGNDFSQSTSPPNLPIFGDPRADITLDLVFPSGNEYFRLEGKSLRLTRPLDRDPDNLASIVFQVTCTVAASRKRRTIPVIVRVSDLNDNAPSFLGIPYTIDLAENTPVNSVVFRNIKAEDADSGLNGLIQYRIVPGDGSPSDGFGVFAINFPHQGIVTVSKPLDFEATSVYFLTLEARDGAPDGSAKTETTIITVKIMDSDDLGPTFSHSEYTGTLPRGTLIGAVDVRPEKIQAEDGDSLRSEIVYSIIKGAPENFNQFFNIDSKTGVVRQIKAIEPNSLVDRFELTLQAEEKTVARMKTETKLTIRLEAEDLHPPQLTVSAREGFVTENSEVGTQVLDAAGSPIKFTVTDRDLSETREGAEYILEFTSDEFSRSPQDELIVNTRTLDRDPPSQPRRMVQVVARENREKGKSSSPVSLLIHLKDVNDNAPVLPAFSSFIIPPGTSRRVVTNLNATDIDEEDSVKYKITEVTNEGKRIFYVNPTTGDLEVIGSVNPGDKFSITVSAKDEAGAMSETIVDIIVSQGPNLGPPDFEKLVYDAKVSESAVRYTTVLKIKAKDPEGGVVTYSILSGNTGDAFRLEESSGVIRVNQTLDRETVESYSLTVKAEDEDGKGSTATVNVHVSDVNDETPAFSNTPYTFRVKEGEVGSTVGMVKAEDRDSKENANVTYSLGDSTDFEIDAFSGEIRTKTALDFEKSQVHYVVITAKDRARDPRVATATATVLVQDISDEVPFFPQTVYEAVVPENEKDFLVATVSAQDKDSISQINYRIMSGELEKFRIDPSTGEIFTIQGLDFEKTKEHVLVIGTEQGLLQGASDNTSTCTVKMVVQDRNDVPPEFTMVPTGNTIYVRNDAKMNDVIGTVDAADKDGTEPGNIVRFELGEGSTDVAAQYFKIEPETGNIILLGDLSNEVYEEYKLTVKAFDQGTPSLSSTVNLLVRVEQVVTLPPNTGIGFTQLEYNIEIMENTPQEAVLTSLSLVDIPQRNIRIRCSVSSAVDKNGRDVEQLFKAEMNENNECNLVLARSVLDYEENTEYKIKMMINTLTAFINPKRKEATIKVRIQDKNDNPPEFLYKEPYNERIKEKYIVTLNTQTKAGSEIFKLTAVDGDSGSLGTVHYEISTETQDTARAFLSVDPVTGVVSTLLDLRKAPVDSLPFRLIINARDNPGQMEDSKMSKTELVVNIVHRENLFVLVLKGATPDLVKPRQKHLEKILSEQTELIVTVDRSVEMQRKDENDTCCVTSQSDTDVWFYALDPETLELLAVNQSLAEERILSRQAQTNIKYIVTGDIHVQASDIHEVYAEASTAAVPSSVAVYSQLYNQYRGYPSFLIAVGCIVFAFSLAAIIYLLYLYSRYKHAKDSLERMIVVPRYEPVFVEPNLKQYETQVLQMSVNIDDVDNDLRIDFRNRSHRFDPGFNLDSVSYITHDTSSTSGSPTQDPEPTSHMTFRAASVSGRLGRPLSRNPSNRNAVEVPVAPESLTHNGFHKEDENLLFHGRQDFNTSTPKKSHSFKTPVDATTQL